MRASLKTNGGARPASWAVMEIRYVSGRENVATRCMADENGEMLALFGVPEGLRRGFGGSPPASDGQPRYQATLAFFHDASLPPSESADYGVRLTQRPVSAISMESPGISITPATLTAHENNLGAFELIPI
jgi:hypothetical protein